MTRLYQGVRGYGIAMCASGDTSVCYAANTRAGDALRNGAVYERPLTHHAIRGTALRVPRATSSCSFDALVVWLAALSYGYACNNVSFVAGDSELSCQTADSHPSAALEPLA